jgi:hypothetical protein
MVARNIPKPETQRTTEAAAETAEHVRESEKPNERSSRFYVTHITRGL